MIRTHKHNFCERDYNKDKLLHIKLYFHILEKYLIIFVGFCNAIPSGLDSNCFLNQLFQNFTIFALGEQIRRKSVVVQLTSILIYKTSTVFYFNSLKDPSG